MELPLPARRASGLSESRVEYMSIFHWTPMVNGYSGNAPRSYLETLEVMQSFPSAESIARLKVLGVEHVILHPRYYNPKDFDELVKRLMALPDFAPPITLADVSDSAWVFQLIRQ